MTDLSLVRLMHLASVSLPVGGYAFSHGMEYAIDAGWIRKADQVEHWVREQLHLGLAGTDIPLLRLSMQACAQEDWHELKRINELTLACRETHELTLTDTAMGEALMRLMNSLQMPQPFSKNEPVSFVCLFALAASLWQIPYRAAANGFLWSWLENQIAAVKHERCRLMSDTQPPWGFLKVFRYLEKFGAVSVGSLYTFGLIGVWETKEDGSWGPRTTPQQKGIKIENRDQALRILTDWNLSKPEWQHFYSPHLKSDMMTRIAKEWKLDGIMLHYNRGCEGLSIGIAENRLALIDEGYPVMTFEGNMGDEREFDEAQTDARIDSFMETLGLEIIEEKAVS